jgi:hypothetical protein
LREAAFFLHRLESTRRPSWVRDPEAFWFYLSAFLGASRSVTFVLAGEFKEYQSWFARWRETRDDQGLLRFMNEQRRLEIHDTGATATRVLTKVDVRHLFELDLRDYDKRNPLRAALESIAQGARVGDSVQISTTTEYSHPVFEFDGRVEGVVEACRRYHDLLVELVNDARASGAR